MITLLAPPGSLVAGATVTLEAEEEHHLAVRRSAPESDIELLDGVGGRGVGRLVPAGKRLTVRLERVSTEPLPTPLVLAVGAGDRDRFGMVVEQGAQLGATTIVPLRTERSAHVATRLRDEHLERLRRRAREAIKQCGAAWAPVVADPLELSELLARPRTGAGWLADEAGEALAALPAAEPLTVVVGPEGGFTPEERTAILAAGFRPRRLGPSRLRFETAALAALTSAWIARQRDRHG
jgi:16S rRNA (uracil1498-N3)-methyltransferase